VLTAGSVIAGYRVEQVLGSGRMGSVYLVRNPDLPRYEALKVLSTDLSQDPEFRARFLREADVAAQLSHPNIVTVYRRGTTEDGELWIAMQFVDGTTADTALRQGQMTPGRAVHIVTEIAKALDYAHRRHLVHRDVKPANILLSGEPTVDERVLLGDFGIAHALGQAELTQEGLVIATVAYAAPEVLAGFPVDGRADLYSLGCTLYRLLTGRTPFPGDGSTAQVVGNHLHAPPPRVTDLVPTLPPAIDGVIATAMAKDPAQRYGSARELAYAAGAALTEPTTVLPPTAWNPRAAHQQPLPLFSPPPRDQARRRRIRTIAGVAALAVVAVVAGVAALSGRPDAPPPPAPIVTAEGLGTLLLPDDKLSTVMGVQMSLDTSATDPIDYSRNLVDTECAAAYAPMAQSMYAGSGYTGLRASNHSSVGADSEGGRSSVQQAAIAFPSAAAATALRDRQLDQWERCANRDVVRKVEGGDPNAVVTFANVVTAEDGVSLLAQSVGSSGFVCDRGLGVRNNVVVDAMVCREDSATQQVLDLVRGVEAEID
jgi:eukaryotic-like serine/threonine-protein kinase